MKRQITGRAVAHGLTMVSAVILTLAAPVTVSASPITYEFSATITIRSDAGGFFDSGQLHVGDVLTGTFSLDPAASDINGAPDIGQYGSATLDFSGGGASYASGAAWVTVTNSDVGSDSLNIAGNVPQPFPALGAQGFANILFSDSSDAVFSSDALPLALNLGSFDQAFFFYRLIPNGGGANSAVRADVTSLTAVGVAEPMSLSLFGLGIVALRLRGWYTGLSRKPR